MIALLFFQWEFQIGPSEGIKIGDHLWMARFILARVAEDFGVRISYESKPVGGKYIGSTAHTNVSTAKTRKKGGMRSVHIFFCYHLALVVVTFIIGNSVQIFKDCVHHYNCWIWLFGIHLSKQTKVNFGTISKQRLTDIARSDQFGIWVIKYAW